MARWSTCRFWQNSRRFFVEFHRKKLFHRSNFFFRLGMSVVHKIENTKTGANDRPAADVKIADCGVIELTEKLVVERKPVDAKI